MSPDSRDWRPDRPVDHPDPAHEPGYPLPSPGWTTGDPLRGLPDDVPALIWSSGPDGRLAFVNRTWLEFTGNDEGQELGRLFERVHPDDLDRALAAYRRALEGRASFHSEFRYRRRDGAWRWLFNTASPGLDADGTFLGFAGACVDITDRKAADERTRQARNLESLGRLAGGLAHDFNNLLTAINGYSEIGLTLAPEAGPLHGFLTEIRNAGERASGLTRQLLAYGRKQVLSAVVFDLNGTLDDMEPVLRRLLGDGIRLERSSQSGLGRIKADPGHAQQLIHSLILNARDAMPQGGSIGVETEDVLAQPEGDGGPRPYVRLSIRDSGPGMDQEAMARVFEPFFSAKPGGARGQGGTGSGLGLSSAYGFARQSGGVLTVESEIGKGSVFRVYIPWIEPEPGMDARIGTEPGPEAGEIAPILIAAEAEGLRRFLSRTLRAEGYPVSEAPGLSSAGSSGTAGSTGEIETIVDAVPGPGLLIAEDPYAHVRASALAARLRARYPALRALSIPISPEVPDLPIPFAGDSVLPLALPLARSELIASVRRSLAAPSPRMPEPGNRAESGSPSG